MDSFTVQRMNGAHPWRRLEEAAHITLQWHDIGPMGWCQHSKQLISLRLGMTQAERRCTLAHELEHLEQGPAITGFEAADEKIVRDLTSRWLITMEDLITALVWSNDDGETAELLSVDVHTLQDRLVNLTSLESVELNQQLVRADLRYPKW